MFAACSIKPILKKVYKADSAKLSKFEKTHESDLVRQPTLKATKKFAVDHKDEDVSSLLLPYHHVGSLAEELIIRPRAASQRPQVNLTELN